MSTVSAPDTNEADLQLPALHVVLQRFDRPQVADIDEAVADELGRLDLGREIKPGHIVAVAVGSRGIRDIARIVRQVVRLLRGLGAEPFVFPAMGSHGGGTAEGQRGVLENLGVTEETVGCPIQSTMEVIELDRIALASAGAATPIYIDRRAAAADHIALVNRVKPHTKLVGSVESGLLKMCLIGLGKREGARSYHRAIERQGWMPVVEAATARLLARAPVRFGLAIIQNAYEEIAELHAVQAADLWSVEPSLLQRARELMGRLPLREIDLLVVDEMGKDISGTGMDTNVTGRKPGSTMKVRHVFVRALTPATHGNAQGIGLADFTTRRLVDEIDHAALYLNSQTAYRTDACKIPMTFDSDREALQTALRMSGVEPVAEQHRLVWIRNTLELERILVSTACLPLLQGQQSVEITSGPLPITFNERGDLIPP